MTAVAGGNIQASDITALQAFTTGKPICRLIQQAAQSFTSGATTALTFGAGSEEVDTHGFHDTASNTARITPTVAGWYTFRGTYVTSAIPATIQNRSVQFRKNGATLIAPAGRDNASIASVTASLSTAAFVLMNGSSDYMELTASQANSGAAAVNTSIATQLTSVFECVFERPQ